MAKLIETEIQQGVATLTFNRPNALNALNTPMAVELAEQLERATQRADVHVIVVTGAGRAFMAGGDVHAMRETLDERPSERRRQIGKLVRHAQLCVQTIVASRKPVMACVNGVAAGFGLSLTAACDVVIAADHATFASAYSRIGASPDGGATFTLPQAVGPRRAAQWLYFGEQYSASEALQMGLVNWVVPASELAAASQARAAQLLALSSNAFAQTKALLSGAAQRSLDAQLVAEQRGFLACAEHDEFREGVDAFVNRRSPVFRTR
ncbi:enoyl-CoA hydratase [Paraburkholderia unamae]|uniref:enoyl-CoA hydratase/isomerase family protein n=1 Tax=Paraburkholderia unamae TaxID=219649 RepID=UPI000DC387BF|nr:enoyl-CoA hydratase-related protein [Paraburkholderia unamae]RAR53344.1 enoyl-CoA hydratase [Paraburkholderia unamae]